MTAKTPNSLPQGRWLLLRHIVAAGHAGADVIVDVAMEHPDAGVVGHHVGNDSGRGQQADHVLAVAADQCRVAVPIRVCRSVSVPGEYRYQRTCLIGQMTITMVTPLPTTVSTPGTLPLFASGLGALGPLRWRRKKKAAGLAAA